MNPLRIRAVNYRSFPDLDLDLPQGCVAFLGENGAGKSSVVNAIDLTIFGPESRSLADALSDTTPDDDLELELDLEHAGAVYRIRRTYSPRGRGKTTLDFERDAAPEAAASLWEPLTRASAKETQELIEQTFGLSRDTFRASAFLAQGDGAAFTEAQPRERKRILGEVLGLDRYDTLLKRVRTDKQSSDAELQQLAGRNAQALSLAAELPTLEREHEALSEARTVTADSVADLEREHAALGLEYQAAREHAAQRTAAEVELREAQAAATRIGEQLERAAVAVQQLSVARDEIASLTTQAQLEELVARETMLQALEQSYREAIATRDAAVTAARNATARRADLLGRASAANEKAETLRTQATLVLEQVGHAECDRCGQTLGAEAATRAAASLRLDAGALDAEAKDLDAQASLMDVAAIPDDPAPPIVDGDTVASHLVAVRSRIAVARNDQAQRARLDERIRSSEKILEQQPSDDDVATVGAAVLEKQEALQTVGEPPVLAAISAKGERVAARLREARQQLEQHATRCARIEERLTVARNAAKTAGEIEKNSESLRAEVDVLAQLERAFSPNGIPALIVENSAVPYLETEATRILAALGTSYRVELRTQAALKTGEGLRDTLDIVVCSDHGERSYETFSGGERTRINLALRIALARLLAHRRGAESRLLAIDEPEFLDEQGTAALVDVLRGLEPDFDRLYLISHVPALRDAFDLVLTVTKDESGSRVTDGYAVAAEAAIA